MHATADHVTLAAARPTAGQRRRGRPPKPADTAFAAYRASPSVGLRNELVERYLHCVRHHAQRLHARLPESVDLDDLVSAGFFGLVKAIDGFDPARNVKFETYCAPRIRGAMLDELRELDPVPRLARQRAKRIDGSRAKLTQRLSRPPSEHELARDLKLSPGDFCRMRDTAAPGGQTITSINDDLFENDGGRFVRLVETLVDRSAIDPADDQRDAFRQLVRCLPRVQRTILHLRYVEDLTHKEIGASFGLSESGISQLYTDAMRILRAQLRR